MLARACICLEQHRPHMFPFSIFHHVPFLSLNGLPFLEQVAFAWRQAPTQPPIHYAANAPHHLAPLPAPTQLASPTNHHHSAALDLHTTTPGFLHWPLSYLFHFAFGCTLTCILPLLYFFHDRLALFFPLCVAPRLPTHPGPYASHLQLSASSYFYTALSHATDNSPTLDSLIYRFTSPTSPYFWRLSSVPAQHLDTRVPTTLSPNTAFKFLIYHHSGLTPPLNSTRIANWHRYLQHVVAATRSV